MSMASAITRLLLIAALVASFPLYFVFIVPEGLLMQVAGGVLILLLVSLLLFTGGPPSPGKRTKSTVVIDQPTDFGDVELPPPVISEDSTTKLRDSKIKRSRGRGPIKEIPTPELPTLETASQAMPPLEDNQTLIPPEEEAEGFAKVHVAKSDPELLAEAEVDRYLEQQRVRRSTFREKLHRDRRIEKSKRLAEELRKWVDLEDMEDLSTLTSIPGHGLAVMYEPEDPNPKIPQGFSYVRIDDNRVLKVRVSLDFPEIHTDPIAEDLEIGMDQIMPLPTDLGMPIPPPDFPDLPPPIGPED